MITLLMLAACGQGWAWSDLTSKSAPAPLPAAPASILRDTPPPPTEPAIPRPAPAPQPIDGWVWSTDGRTTRYRWGHLLNGRLVETMPTVAPAGSWVAVTVTGCASGTCPR